MVVHVELSVANQEAETIHDLGGTAQIKVPYALPDSVRGELISYRIAEDGLPAAASVKYGNGYATISTQHLSDFALLVSDSMFSINDGVFCCCDASLQKLSVSGLSDGKSLCLVSYTANGQMLKYTEINSAGEITLPENTHRVKLLSLDAQFRPCAEQTVFEVAA